jgi:hypothetical protein
MQAEANQNASKRNREAKISTKIIRTCPKELDKFLRIVYSLRYLYVQNKTTRVQMLRRITLTAVAVVVAGMVSGCANAPQPVAADPVDNIIATNAAQATKALRELSETTGNSRVVKSADTGPRSDANPKVNVEPAQDARVVTSTESGPRSVAHPKGIAAPAQDARVVAQSPVIRPAIKSIAESASAVAVEVLPLEAKKTSPAIAVQPDVKAATGGLLSGAPAGLDKKISIHWVGELEQLLGKIADETGWKMADSVGLIVAPVLISVKADNRPAYEVLRDIGAITGTSAEIRISTASKTISVRYPIR